MIDLAQAIITKQLNICETASNSIVKSVNCNLQMYAADKRLKMDRI